MNELPGHRVDVTALDDVVNVLRCECGWVVAAHVDEVDTNRELHWVAKQIEAEVLNELLNE